MDKRWFGTSAGNADKTTSSKSCSYLSNQESCQKHCRGNVLSEIVGQDEAVNCLRRVVDGSLRKPLLLVGDEGVGRKASALAAIREIVSAARGGPDSPAVVQVERGVHPDVIVVAPPPDKEMDVDSVREVVASAQQHPVASPCRFFILDGADRMTSAAANAVLKTLEEPPEFSRFFLLAESFERVIPTIRSRCGRVDYRILPESFVFERVSQFERNRDKALVYARLGEGSIGRATRFWGSNRIVVRDKCVEILRQGLAGDLPAAFSILDEFSKDLPIVLRMLVFVTHDLLVLPSAPNRIVNVDIQEDLSDMYARFGKDTLANLWRALRTAWVRYESVHVNLPLQVKAALMAAFIG